MLKVSDPFTCFMPGFVSKIFIKSFEKIMFQNVCSNIYCSCFTIYQYYIFFSLSFLGKSLKKWWNQFNPGEYFSVSQFKKKNHSRIGLDLLQMVFRIGLRIAMILTSKYFWDAVFHWHSKISEHLNNYLTRLRKLFRGENNYSMEETELRYLNFFGILKYVPINSKSSCISNNA